MGVEDNYLDSLADAYGLKGYSIMLTPDDTISAWEKLFEPWPQWKFLEMETETMFHFRLRKIKERLVLIASELKFRLRVLVYGYDLEDCWD